MHVMQREALLLAALADIDVRTARKILERGIESVRGRPRERAAVALPKVRAHFARPSEPPPSVRP